jgi:hypothetical protein
LVVIAVISVALTKSMAGSIVKVVVSALLLILVALVMPAALAMVVLLLLAKRLWTDLPPPEEHRLDASARTVLWLTDRAYGPSGCALQVG